VKTEAVAKLVDLSGHGFGIGGVAIEDLDGNRTTLGICEKPKNDLSSTGLIVA
jgi:hypothetical protein